MNDLITKTKEFLDKEFPNNQILIKAMGNMSAHLIKSTAQKDQRPGNTISGPTLMALADAAAYIALIGEGISNKTVTSQLNINFLAKPEPKMDLIAKSEILKLGKTLAVIEVKIYSSDKLVANSTISYAIPN